jgi:hypothetical protein
MDWNKLLELLAPVATYLLAYFLHRAPKAPPEPK